MDVSSWTPETEDFPKKMAFKNTKQKPTKASYIMWVIF